MVIVTVPETAPVGTFTITAESVIVAVPRSADLAAAPDPKTTAEVPVNAVPLIVTSTPNFAAAGENDEIVGMSY